MKNTGFKTKCAALTIGLALTAGAALAQSLDFPSKTWGLSFGNSKEFSGLRFNFRDSQVKSIKGVNVTLWQPRDDNEDSVITGLSLGVIAGGGHLRGVQIGLLGVAGSRSVTGVSMAWLGIGAGDDLTGINFAGLGHGRGQEHRRLQYRRVGYGRRGKPLRGQHRRPRNGRGQGHGRHQYRRARVSAGATT